MQRPLHDRLLAGIQRFRRHINRCDVKLRIESLQEAGGETRSPDGRLWFSNGAVLQMVDPTHLHPNATPAPVHIEQIIADHKNCSIAGPILLPPLTRDLEIDYVAPSFTAPQKHGWALINLELNGRREDVLQAAATSIDPKDFAVEPGIVRATDFAHSTRDEQRAPPDRLSKIFAAVRESPQKRRLQG